MNISLDLQSEVYILNKYKYIKIPKMCFYIDIELKNMTHCLLIYVGKNEKKTKYK